MAQDLKNLAGKILRMELNGEIPVDNPFTDSYIYSYGHRNSQGLTWNDDGSQMYSADHGPIGYDEINFIQLGKNYGWPVIKGDEEKEGMEGPLIHSGSSTWAPSGIDYLEGKLYVAGLRGEKLLTFDIEAESIEVVIEDIGRIRDVLVHDGEIYIITNNRDGRGEPKPSDDRLLKLR
jgi:glucose/arabinose dehydrogenase